MVTYLIGYLSQMLQAGAAAFMLVSASGRREPFLARAAGVGAAMLLLGAAVYPLYSIAGSLLFRTLFFTGIFLLIFGSMLALYDVPIWQALFCCTMGYATQNLMSGTAEALRLASGIGLPTAIDRLALLIPSTLVVLLPYYFLFARKVEHEGMTSSSDRTATLLALVTVLAVIGLDICIKSVSRAAGIPLETSLFMRLTHGVICIFILYCGYETLYRRRLSTQRALSERLMAERERQYQLSRANIEAINIKCHDMRHQIRSLRGQCVDERALEDLTREISVYDSMVETGNEALNTILTEKGLICSREHISLSIIADGSAVGFLEDSEVYAFFGNALDNAIEASLQITDPERRQISLVVERKGMMTLVKVENYFDPSCAPTFRGDLPASSKGDDLNHGFGTRSMKQIVERHDGDFRVSVTDSGIFRLTALFAEV